MHALGAVAVEVLTSVGIGHLPGLEVLGRDPPRASSCMPRASLSRGSQAFVFLSNCGIREW